MQPLPQAMERAGTRGFRNAVSSDPGKPLASESAAKKRNMQKVFLNFRDFLEFLQKKEIFVKT